MEKYGDNDYVVDDDIVKKIDMGIILEIHDRLFPSYTSLTLSKPFNPSKPFKITCKVIFNSLHTGQNTGFVIVSNRTNIASCKARVNMVDDSPEEYSNSNSYWVTADSFGEWNFGTTKEGQLFEYEFVGNGYGNHPSVTSNLPFVGSSYVALNPVNVDCDKIYIGYDPRDSANQKAPNVYFKELIIYQD